MSNIKRRYSVSVREFVEFSLRGGDLHATMMRPGRPQEGTRIHLQIQRARPQNYQSEVTISYTYETADLILDINGRIDGVFKNEDEVFLTSSEAESFRQQGINTLQEILDQKI